MGDVFVEFGGGGEFVAYSDFVSNYSVAMMALKEISKWPAFAKLIEENKLKQGKRAFSLADLLITPVQRIPRYVLLLRELKKHTAADHDDCLLLMDAIAQLE